MQDRSHSLHSLFGTICRTDLKSLKGQEATAIFANIVATCCNRGQPEKALAGSLHAILIKVHGHRPLAWYYLTWHGVTVFEWTACAPHCLGGGLHVANRLWPRVGTESTRRESISHWPKTNKAVLFLWRQKRLASHIRTALQRLAPCVAKARSFVRSLNQCHLKQEMRKSTQVCLPIPSGQIQNNVQSVVVAGEVS